MATITFQVNLVPFATEAEGPNTNLVNPHVLNPYRYQSDQDEAVVQMANLANTRSWMPEITGLAAVLGQQGVTDGGVPELKNGDQFTVSGWLAYHVQKRFATGPNAILTVVS